MEEIRGRQRIVMKKNLRSKEFLIRGRSGGNIQSQERGTTVHEPINKYKGRVFSKYS
jgi:hypothetical protein